VKVKFLPTFSGLPKEPQGSVKKYQQSNTKGFFHPDSDSIWVVFG
jgi:hypothetical protein